MAGFVVVFPLQEEGIGVGVDGGPIVASHENGMSLGLMLSTWTSEVRAALRPSLSCGRSWAVVGS